MSTALDERKTGVISSSEKGEAGVDFSPLLGLLDQGDAAAQAASSILAGLAVERPLLVLPEVGFPLFPCVFLFRAVFCTV